MANQGGNEKVRVNLTVWTRPYPCREPEEGKSRIYISVQTGMEVGDASAL